MVKPRTDQSPVSKRKKALRKSLNDLHTRVMIDAGYLEWNPEDSVEAEIKKTENHWTWNRGRSLLNAARDSCNILTVMGFGFCLSEILGLRGAQFGGSLKSGTRPRSLVGVVFGRLLAWFGSLMWPQLYTAETAGWWATRIIFVWI